MGLGRRGVGMPRVDGGQGGVGTPKWMWGEVWGAETPSGDVGVQPMGYSSLLGSGRGVWGPPRGVWGWWGAGRPKGAWGPHRGAVGMEPKGCGEVGAKRWAMGTPKGGVGRDGG